MRNKLIIWFYYWYADTLIPFCKKLDKIINKYKNRQSMDLQELNKLEQRIKYYKDGFKNEYDKNTSFYDAVRIAQELLYELKKRIKETER